MKLGILLAAGKGTRMKCDVPKVLLDFCGEPLGFVPLKRLLPVVDHCVVVVGHQGGLVKDQLLSRAIECFGKDVVDSKIHFVTQEPPSGTGDAVRVAVEFSNNKNFLAKEILVANGDLPLVTENSFQTLIDLASERKLSAACLSFRSVEPAELGRIIRSETGSLEAIREFSDCSDSEKKITEVNSGVYYFSGEYVNQAVQSLTKDNKQGEFYLTDLLKSDSSSGIITEAIDYKKSQELIGANTFFELSEAAEIAQKILRKYWAEEKGVFFSGAATCQLSVDTKFLGTAAVGPNTTFIGKNTIAENVRIHGNSYFENCEIKKNAVVKWSCVCTDSEIGEEAIVGPMAHLRPNSIIGAKVKVGNFVELKNTTLKTGSKVSHLSYLGDTTVGEESNIGCGTITCNYDGFNKYHTIIGKKSFIGSDTQLIAPVEIGDHAYVGSGTTVTKDVPAGALAISRTPIEIKKDYAKKLSAIKAKKKTSKKT